jgi:TP901 family phage tail tape measure protein
MAKIILDVELKNTLATQQLKQLETSIKSVADSLSGVKVNKDLTTQINSLTKYYNSLAKVAQKTLQVNNKNAIAEQKLAQEKAKTATAMAKQADAENKEFTSKIKATKAVEDYTKTEQKNTKAIKENTQANKDNQQSMLSMMQGFLRWQVVATLVMKPLNLIRSAFASINTTLVETEDRIIELQRVLPSGSIGDKDLSDKLYKMAQEYGQTFENVSQIALNFARSGMNTVETLKATEAAVVALNVAELDATQASDGLIAIMQQFGLSADDLMLIVDKLNITADNAAVTTDKLLTALQRTGSSAKNANLNLDETVSIITALSEATGRSGENLGTAVNSLIQFSTKSSALDTFAKLSENMANIVNDFRHGKGTVLDIWQGLSEEIKNTNGQNESILGTLFTDDDWRNLNDELQDALGENYAKVTEIYDTASTFRKNYFIALLNNMDSVKKAQETLADAAGYSQKENEEYLDTYTAKLNSLKEQWRALVNDEQGFLGFKKVLVQIASWLLTAVKYTGGLHSIILTTASALTLLYAPKIMEGLNKLKNRIKEVVTELKNVKSASAASKAGLVGLALAAIVTIISVSNQIAKSISEAKTAVIEKAFEDYENIKESADKLSSLYSAYQQYSSIQNRTVEQDKTYSQIQKDIVESLGNRAKALKGLTEGTKEYNDKLNEITSEEMLSNANKASKVAKEYEYRFQHEEGLTGSGWFNEVQHKYYDGWKAIWDDLWENERGDPNSLDDSLAWNKFIENFQKEMPIADRISYLRKMSKRYLDAGNDKRAGYVNEIADYYQKQYDAYIEAKIRELTYSQLAKGDISSQEDYESLFNRIVNTLSKYGEVNEADVKDILDNLLRSESKGFNNVDVWSNDLSKVASKYKDIANALKEIRDTQKETADYEEKRLAVLEAEKALTEAQNQRNVRVFNAETGNWEWQRNEEAVEKAQKNLDKAKENVQDAAWDDVLNLLDKDSTTNKELLETLDKWAKAYEGTFGEGETPEFVDKIIDAIEKSGRVHIRSTEGEEGADGTTDGEETPTYDSGGVLHGLGGIKATSRDEIVLPPELAEKILNPTSNAQFKAFADSLGLLFGATNRSPILSRSDIITNGGSTVNNSNSNAYVVNGVPISAEDAQTKTIVQLFENMGLVN